MEMNNFWILFLVFTVYSFLGWLTESIFCSVPVGKFINRGFLIGPFCPVYGLGGVLVVSILTQFQHDVIALYLAGVILTSLLEYLTGFALEKIFHTTYWDYSSHRFNLRGRVCLQNSLLFGVMCVVGMLYIHPALMRFLNLIPAMILPFISIGFMVYFICDAVVTIHAILQLNGKLSELQQILDEMKERASNAAAETLENLQAKIGDFLDDDTRINLRTQYEKKEKIEADIKFFQRRVIDAFPTMKSIQNNESLQRIKEAIQSKAKNIKRN
jgi:uncharacterized membrane protein